MAGLLAVAACAGRPPPAKDHPATATASVTIPRPPDISQKTIPTKIPPPSKATAPTAPTASLVPSAPPRASPAAPAPVSIRAGALIGMSARAVEKILGPPRFVRHDLQVQIWQYASAACVLDLFLYPPAMGGEKDEVKVKNLPSTQTPRSVLHVESHTREGVPMADDTCLRTFEVPAS